jgi:CheY-like chemotaxis protein
VKSAGASGSAVVIHRVLLVDDNPHAQRMGREILSQEGYEVLGVTDGAESLSKLQEFAPDVVLADVAMPAHSGYELCERIKTDPAMGHVRVILLVGALEPLNAAEAKRVGADAVLHKPFEPSLVIQTVGPLRSKAASGRGGARGEFEDVVQKALERPDHLSHEQVRAAVVLAVESALPSFVEDVTRRVVQTLRRDR